MKFPYAVPANSRVVIPAGLDIVTIHQRRGF
jgi:hypothetical protein